MNATKMIAVVLIVLLSITATACLNAEERQDVKIWETFKAGDIDGAYDLVNAYYAEDEEKIASWTKVMMDETGPTQEDVTTPEPLADYSLVFSISDEQLETVNEAYEYNAILTNDSNETYDTIVVMIEGCDRFGKPLVSAKIAVAQALKPKEAIPISSTMTYDKLVGYYLAYVVEAKEK